MAKEPRTPKSKTGAPKQFDMNSCERKGGKGGPGRRGRDDNRPPNRIEKLPPSLANAARDRPFGKSARSIKSPMLPPARNTD